MTFDWINIYLITDTHFNHTKCWKERRWRSEQIIRDELLLLQPEDVLIHLWDVCLWWDNEAHNFIQQIKAKKILVRGNHDRKSRSRYMRHGWDFVCESFDAIFYGQKILFTHKPEDVRSRNSWKEPSTINIHWHFHQNDNAHAYPWYSQQNYCLRLEDSYAPTKLTQKLLSKILSNAKPIHKPNQTLLQTLRNIDMERTKLTVQTM